MASEPEGQTVDRAAEYARIRRRRNLAVGLVLAAVVVLFFLMTIVRIGNFYGP